MIGEFQHRSFRLVCFRNYCVTGASGIFRHWKLYARARFP
jgi:hypothetical protein